MNGLEFLERFGYIPEHDDLDRVNCNKVGEIGHWACGICPNHNKPRFECGCLVTLKLVAEGKDATFPVDYDHVWVGKYEKRPKPVITDRDIKRALRNRGKKRY